MKFRTRSLHASRPPLAVIWLVIVMVSAMLLTSCAPGGGTRAPEAIKLQIAAAADLTPAFEELGKAFERDTKIEIVFNFGSTGNLTRQIENGLPVDLFAAANVAFIDQLEAEGLLLPDTKEIYARGRITIWVRPDSPLKVEKLEELTRPEIKHVAIANPEHAPYGLAAQQALQSLRLWEIIRPKLVFGENVRQTTQFAETGNADVAITALSLSVQSNGRWTLIPEDLHKPLDQALAVLKSTAHEKETRQFIAFINSPQGQEIMKKYGFNK